jgi:hypothetical protein
MQPALKQKVQESSAPTRQWKESQIKEYTAFNQARSLNRVVVVIVQLSCLPAPLGSAKTYPSFGYKKCYISSGDFHRFQFCRVLHI